MSTLEFLKSLNYNDGLSVVKSIIHYFPMQYGTTLGLDGRPQIRPLEFKFEEDGVLYFDTIEDYTSYQEMKKFPYLQICIGDQKTMSYLRIEGSVNFTKDMDIVEKCFEHSEVLTRQYGLQKEKAVAYYLTNVKAEFCSFLDELPNKKYSLKNKFDK